MVVVLGVGALLLTPLGWTEEHKMYDRASRELASARKEAAAAGIILDRNLLEGAEEVPDSENGAIPILKAAELLQKNRDLRLAARDSLSNSPQFAGLNGTQSRQWALLKPVFDLANEAASRSRIRFNRTGSKPEADFNDNHPAVGVGRLMARLVLLRAQKQLDAKNYDGAFEDFERALKLTDLIGQEPVVLAGVAQAGVRLSVVARMETLVAQNPGNSALLKRVQELLARREDSVHPANSLRGEAAQDYAYITDPNTYTMEGLSKLMPGMRAEEDGAPPEVFYSFVPRGVPREKIAAAYETRYLQAMTRMYMAAKAEKDSAAAALAAEKVFHKILSEDDPAARIPYQVVTWPGIPKRWVNHAARTRTLKAALAALIHKAEKGSAPATLVEAGDRQQDPWSPGRPLIYRLDEGGLLVYSVGSDGEDNGGVGGRETRNMESLDVEYRVKL